MTKEEQAAEYKKNRTMARIHYEGKFCVFSEPGNAIEEIGVFLREQDPPSEMRVELIQMSMEEFDSLGEFDGW